MKTVGLGGTQVLLVLLAQLLLAPAVHAQIERTHRDEWQNVDSISSALDLKPGDRVADIGAGGGFLSLRLADKVGPLGWVVAQDIDRQALDELRRQLAVLSIHNVEVVVGEADDPNLPPQSIDAAVIVNAYHEMAEYEAMLAGIKRALRPGGRLVILDNPPANPEASRRSQTTRHDIDIDLVAREVEAAGFRIVARDPRFIVTREGGHAHREWMLVAERPKGDDPSHRPASQ